MIKEQVDGISRFHEMMTIERNEDGTIKQVYDYQDNPIETKMLYLSWLSKPVEDGIYYKEEFISLENSIEIGKKRNQGFQRMRTLLGHEGKDVL